MNGDQLRERLAATDPTANDPVLSTDDPGARALLEEIMSTSPDVAEPSSPDQPPAPRPRRWWVPATGIAAAAVLVLGGLAVGGAFDGSDAPDEVIADDPISDHPLTTPTTTPEPSAAVELSLGQGQDPLASCLRVDPEVLRPVAVAFAGDVAAIDGETVTIDVTRWYVGGDAPVVVMTAPAGLEALLGTVEFEVGESFLISSGDGRVVNYCGWSGAATAELQAIYDAAFAG